jgi:adenosylcobinamide-phosphate synthase
MLIALALDVAFGWSNALYQRIGHPVSWLGRAISWADVRFNDAAKSDVARKRAGVFVVLGLLAGVGGLAWAVALILPGGWLGLVLTGVLAWPLVAARSLHDHVEAVVHPLSAGTLDEARHEISKIVGRDPSTLDAAAMGRAGLETLAENASDGVIAPLFWGALFGLPGIAVYKAINTMDSMIGYRTPRHLAFGWAAARVDDLANWVPARLTGVLIAVVSKARGTSFRTMMRDARGHRSPNAGWPEAAMAGALGVRLSGPRMYTDGPSEDPFLNPVGGDPRPEDILLGLRLFRRVVLCAGLGLGVWALF